MTAQEGELGLLNYRCDQQRAGDRRIGDGILRILRNVGRVTMLSYMEDDL